MSFAGCVVAVLCAVAACFRIINVFCISTIDVRHEECIVYEECTLSYFFTKYRFLSLSDSLRISSLTVLLCFNRKIVTFV